MLPCQWHISIPVKNVWMTYSIVPVYVFVFKSFVPFYIENVPLLLIYQIKITLCWKCNILVIFNFFLKTNFSKSKSDLCTIHWTTFLLSIYVVLFIVIFNLDRRNLIQQSPSYFNNFFHLFVFLIFFLLNSFYNLTTTAS